MQHSYFIDVSIGSYICSVQKHKSRFRSERIESSFLLVCFTLKFNFMKRSSKGKLSFNFNYQRCFCSILFLLLLCMQINAQDRHTIVGRVTDVKGEFMVGVTIMEKGTSNGVITDLNGQYSLKATTNSPTLIFTYMGYKTQEVKAGKKTVVDVVMEEDVAALDEVVVVGYGNQRKISVVGAQSSIKMDNIKVATGDLTSTIAGRIPGVVTIQRSGEPGSSGSDIWIRGISTFTSSSPLVLVDGVERSFNHLDTEDIESFSVLKDASATAVYGVRGANGVILIKTKPGRIGKPEFQADYYEGVSMLTKKIKLADPYQYMDAANAAYGNDNGGNVLYTPQFIEATKKANGALPNDNPSMYNPYLYPAVNWMDEIFRDMGHNRHANISVRGGSTNATYYASLSYYNESGLLKTTSMKDEHYNINTNYNRFNFTSNLNLRPTKMLTVDLGINGFISETDLPQQSSGDLYQAAMNINPVYFPVEMPDGSIPGKDSNERDANPYAMLTRRGYQNNYNSKIFTNVRATHDLGFWKWSKGLSATALVAFDTWTGRTLNYNKNESTYWFTGSKDQNTGLWNNDVFDENGGFKTTRIHFSGDDQLNYGGGSTGSDRSVYFEASLNYDHSFGLHRVGGLVLYNQKSYRNTTANDLLSTLPHKSQSLAGRITYSWNDRYFGEFNVGYNGSENFVPGKRFGTFPAFGLGWAVSNEKFWEPIQKYVSYLKFRYTNGWVGSDDAGERFLYESLMGGAQDYFFGDWKSDGGWSVYRYGYDVTWSKSHKQDWGVDAKFLNDRLSLTVDYFREHRTGIFLQRQTLPTYLGLSSIPKGNLGIVDNSGFEFQTEWSQRINKLMSFTLRGNVSWNRDKIIENDDAPRPFPWMERRGTNVFGQWGYISDGLFTSEDDIAQHATQFGKLEVGDVKYRDLNGDGKIDDNDIRWIGQGTVPKYNYGFGFDFNVGHFTISALFQGASKVTTCLSGNSIIPFSSQTGIDNLYANIDDRWSADDPTNQDVFYPRLHYGNSNNSNNSRTSTWWLRDMSYLRLKQLNISYNIPENVLKPIRVKSARVYFMGTNVLTFSKFKLWDPEVYSSNGAAYPNISSYSLGLNFSF